ncbi:MAG: cyclic nucleotide-binding domain-containing protein [Burkholderiaceae bacterium]
MLRARLDLLQQMPVFGAIREDALQSLLERAGTMQIAAGDFFFREQDQASSMFVLEVGQVAVAKGWQGRDFLLNRLHAGDCFGEMALMDLQPRSASVRAEADCRAIEFGTGDLLRLFERDVEQFALVQMNLGREVCRRLRATDDLIFRVRMGEQLPELRPLPLTA